jgi:transposase-like protein
MVARPGGRGHLPREGNTTMSIIARKVRGRPQHPPDVKAEILRRYRDDRIPVAQLARESGVGRRTIFRWIEGEKVSSVPSPSAQGSEATAPAGAEPVEDISDSSPEDGGTPSGVTSLEDLDTTKGIAMPDYQRTELPLAKCPFCPVEFKGQVPGGHYAFCAGAPDDVKTAAEMAREAMAGQIVEAWNLVREFVDANVS